MTTEAELQAVYDTLPTIACQRKCQAVCGPIPMSQPEFSRLVLVTGRVPHFDATTKRCGYLTPWNECQVHALRPLICRLFGVVRGMACPHGCKPSRWLSDAEARRIIDLVTALGGGRVDMTRPKPDTGASNH